MAPPTTPETVFEQAIAIADDSQRAEYLDRACGGDAQLRAEAQRLVRDHFRAGSFLERPALAVDVTSSPGSEQIAQQIGSQIGPYKLLEQIGEGGMGLVYMAEQQRPVRRLVALKIIKPGMDSKQVIARFEAERQALAIMDHPHIAKVLDASTTETGRPYFVMELVRGLAINEFCDEKRLSVRQRLELFIQVCQAVQHAHQKGIIHRDLKPSNVLVTMHDAVPVPMIIDFGIAKALGQQLTEHTLHTGYAQLVGTPLYMSPEQAEMNQLGVDTRSDIYSLGVMLYELLTGTTPFDKETLTKAGYNEMRRIIREEEPQRPSHRVSTLQAQALSTVSNRRSVDPRRISTELRGELDWIVMRALEKERNRRYESASGLAADIQRYLNGEFIHACPPSTLYRFRKFARRNKAAFTTAALLTTSLLLGTTVSIWQALRATAAETQATANEAKAKEEGQKALAEQQKALAAAASERAAKEAETAQRKQAERNFEAALDAVERMLANTYDETLRDIPRARLLQNKMLQDAIAFFERLPQDGISIQARFRIGMIWSDIARLNRDGGDVELTKRAYNTALEELARVNELEPKHPLYLDKLAFVEYMVGWFYAHNLKDFDEAEKHHRRELEICVLMAQEEPNQQAWLIRQASAWKGLSETFAAAGKPDKAIDAVRQSLRLLDRANATGYYQGGHTHALAMLLRRDNPEEAETLFRRGIAVFRGYLRQGQVWPDARLSFANQLQNTATFFEQRHPEEVEALLDESISVMRDDLAMPTSTRKGFFSGRFENGLYQQTNFLRRRAVQSGVAPEQARQHLAKAQSLRSELIDQRRKRVAFSADKTSRYDLVKILHEESTYLLGQGANQLSDPTRSANDRRVQADALLTEAIQLCRALAAEFSDNIDYKNRLADLLKLHAQHFAPTPNVSSEKIAPGK